jgi:branched-chain amino acid transport system permease protein
MRRGVNAGLLAAAVILYLVLVGMTASFTEIRLIEDGVTLGGLLAIAPLFVAGYLLARPRRGDDDAPGARAALRASAIAGVVTAVCVGVAVGVYEWIGPALVESVFVHANGESLAVLVFSRSIAAGLVLYAVAGVALAVLGAALRLVPARIRTPLEAGLLSVLLLAMLQNVFRVMFVQLGLPTKWLYSSRYGGLTIAGAIAVFALGVAVAVAIRFQRTVVHRRRAARTTAEPQDVPSGGVGTRSLRWWLAATAIVVGLALLPQVVGTFLSAVLGQVGIFMLMGLGLNVVVGYAGLLDLGYVAFYATGAYATALLTAPNGSGSSIHLGLQYFEALPIVICIALLVGVAIGAPVLRLRGDYLAIVTLGLGEIARVIVVSDWAAPLLGGAPGLLRIPAPVLSIGSLTINFREPENFYYLVLGFVALAAFVSWRLSTSRVGRAWVAMREDEQVAEATGVSTVRFKLLAFMIGAGVGAIAGSLFAVQIGSLAPSSFTVLVSIQVLAVVILGGMGSIRGVLLGALLLVGLPGFLSEFEEYQLLIYGAALIAMMLLRPQGLVPNTRRERELREEDRAQDKWAGDVAGDEHVAPGISPIGEGAG